MATDPISRLHTFAPATSSSCGAPPPASPRPCPLFLLRGSGLSLVPGSLSHTRTHIHAHTHHAHTHTQTCLLLGDAMARAAATLSARVSPWPSPPPSLCPSHGNQSHIVSLTGRSPWGPQPPPTSQPRSRWGGAGVAQEHGPQAPGGNLLPKGSSSLQGPCQPPRHAEDRFTGRISPTDRGSHHRRVLSPGPPVLETGARGPGGGRAGSSEASLLAWRRPFSPCLFTGSSLCVWLCPDGLGPTLMTSP